LRNGRQPPKEEKQKVPAYIVTFSDMVTLLLTFFVLLLTLAEVQDPELFNMGRDSFFESIRFCGLGMLLGRHMSPDLGAEKLLHRTSNPEDSDQRTLDERRDQLRQIFERLSESAVTLPSQLVGEHLDFSITNIQYEPGQTQLNQAAKDYLTRYCIDLKQNLSSRTTRLYIVGLAGQEATEMKQWTLSAQRAQTVAEFIKSQLDTGNTGQTTSSTLDQPPPWHVFWWGAGPGGNWAGQDRPGSGQSQILIAVLKSVG